MGRSLRELLARLFREEEGQAATEYAVVISATMLLLVGVSAAVISALSAYYVETTSLICLPIP